MNATTTEETMMDKTSLMIAAAEAAWAFAQVMFDDAALADPVLAAKARQQLDAGESLTLTTVFGANATRFELATRDADGNVRRIGHVDPETRLLS